MPNFHNFSEKRNKMPRLQNKRDRYPVIRENIYLRERTRQTLKKKISALAAFLFLTTLLGAQEQISPFGFLEMPQSSHEAALGGRNVSVLSGDPSFVYSNPATLAGIGRRRLGLNVLTWMSGTTAAGAQFCDTVGRRGAYSVNARYINYGVSSMTDPTGTETGTFSSRDIALAGSYSYRLGERLIGGVSLRMLYSKYSFYSSFAMSADLGLLYHSKSGRFNAGVSFTNIGGQLKPFTDIYEYLPFDITAGVSFRLEHAPLQLSFTMDRLNKWNSGDFYAPEGSLSDGEMLARHIMLGVDVLITDRIYASLGYNFRHAAELSTAGHKGLTGFTIGAGVDLNRISFGLSFGKFQVSSSSLLFNFALDI